MYENVFAEHLHGKVNIKKIISTNHTTMNKLASYLRDRRKK